MYTIKLGNAVQEYSSEAEFERAYIDLLLSGKHAFGYQGEELVFVCDNYKEQFRRSMIMASGDGWEKPTLALVQEVLGRFGKYSKLAKKMGLVYGTFNNYMNGVSYPNYITWFYILLHLGVPYDATEYIRNQNTK